MPRQLRLYDLSAPRQALVRLFQSIGFGQVVGLHVRGGEPMFDPEPGVLLEVRLDTDDPPRPEGDLADFALKQEVVRLFERIDGMCTGRIDRIEIQAGLPRRVVFEASLNRERP